MISFTFIFIGWKVCRFIPYFFNGMWCRTFFCVFDDTKNWKYKIS